MTLSKEGLDAAHAAYAKTTGGMLEGHPMANAITAYLETARNSQERRRRAAGPSEVRWPMPDPLKKYKDAALPSPDGLVERDTHLLAWLDDAYVHCQHGSQDWCESYLRNAADVIRSQDTVIQTLQRSVHELEESVSALEAEVRDMRDENARMREALTRIAEMDGTAGTEKGPPCEWTKNGVTTIRPSGIGNFANHIARLALKNQESDREV